MDHQDHADAKATSIDEVGFSSSPDSLNERPDVSGAGISTVDALPGKDAKGTPASGQSTEGDGKAAPDDKKADGEIKAADSAGQDTGKKGQEGRYDKDPDWQRMKAERDEAVLKAAQLQGVIDAGIKGTTGEGAAAVAATGEGPAPILPYKDITKMSKEELIEWFEDDPVGYEANRFAQFLHEAEVIRTQREEGAKRANTVKETFDSYVKENPDFQDRWASGEIKRYMETHPGHNAISAHMMLTKEKEGERTQTLVDKAVRDAVEKERANFRAKRNADTIGDGAGSIKPGSGGDELKDTNSQGGLVSAIAGRLSRMRQQAA
jgi:hypothetical protein